MAEFNLDNLGDQHINREYYYGYDYYDNTLDNNLEFDCMVMEQEMFFTEHGCLSYFLDKKMDRCIASGGVSLNRVHEYRRRQNKLVEEKFKQLFDDPDVGEL